MLNWIIDLSLRHRFRVVAIALAFAAVGAFSLGRLDIDAFPDTTPVQIQVNTIAPSLAPEEVERQITFPVEQAISGLPGLEMVRSISKFGLSQVVVTFEDGTDIYFARQIIFERLGAVELPAGIERPKMGPVSTGLGEVFHYVLTYEGYDFSKMPENERIEKLSELRTIHDWVVKPQLRSIPGVAEVNGWGGYEKQYQVRIDPDRLIKHGLTFDRITEAVAENNRNVGGGSIRVGARMLLVHGQGRTADLEQIGNIVITAEDGVPIRVRDVSDVQTGGEIRLGAVTAHGRGEAVLGLGFMLMGENSHEVTWALKSKLQEIRASLPPGVTIQTVYDRTELVDGVIDTVRKNLFEGGLLVVAVLFIFLGNLRAGLIVALAIPLSMLFAFSGMLQFGIAASLLSLGALDFGLIVDSSVVVVENCVRHLAQAKKGINPICAKHPPGRSGKWGLSPFSDRLQIIRDAAVEVRKPTMFGELIIMIVYLPILALEGVEGKLFRPMALTVIFALAGSMVLSLTLMPVLASLMLPSRIDEREPLVLRLLKRLYAPVLRFTMHHKPAVLGFAVGLLAVAFGMIAPNLGSEFIPKLSEGSIVVNVVRLAGIDLEESIRYNTRMEKALLAAFPDEILYAWSRIGAAEVATDPMGVELSDIFIALRPRERWKRAATQNELTDLIQKELRDMPGQRVAMTQPIEMRMNEMISGVRSDVAAILYGDDFDALAKKAAEIERVLKSIPGAADVSAEQVTGQPVLQIRIDQDEIARCGISANAVLGLVEALGGKRLGDVYDGQLRFPLIVRLPESVRASPEAIGSVQVTAPSGQRIPLSRLAAIESVEGPSTIKREWYQRRITVSANVRGRDMVGFVAEARRKVAAGVQLPPGRYRVEWGGQFEHYERARQRLLVVVPLALTLIFGLLYLTYRNLIDALRVFTAVPFAWVGGIFALWLRDMPFSISAAVGFVALSGVAVLDDMLLVSCIRQLRNRGMELERAVEEGAMTRLRPVLMTALVASLGFVPMAFNEGLGAEVQRPLATVVIGGIFSAMVMSLLVLRVLYMVFSGPTGSSENTTQAETESRRVPEPIST
ncbi:MAG: efflux RND transporter permease subunit [Pirellulales bacterium]|nr:efflux RND transporter permease subunit [Pirellulales bacterium]